MQLKNVSKTIEHKQILKDINLEVKPGEIVGLVGPNGAGKTTTMKIMSGLTVNYEGVVEGNERIGLLIDGPKYFPDKSAAENLAYFQALSRESYQLDYILDLFDMGSYQKKKVKNFSLGMKQRLGMALALINKNDLLILDEPMNGLDLDGVQATIQTLKHLAKDLHLAIIISSHILGDLEKLCDRVYFIKNGEIVRQAALGQVEELFYQFIFAQEDVSAAEKLLQLATGVEKIGDRFLVPAPQREEILKLLVASDVLPLEMKKQQSSLAEMYFSI